MRRAFLIAAIAAAAARVGAAQAAPPDSVRRDTTRAGRTPAADSTAPRDSTGTRPAGRDSTGAARVARDSVKAPFARAERPAAAARSLDRDALFRSGAVTALDLFERIPGFNGLRGGWIPTPHVATWLGEPGRARVYWDGVELDALDPRDGGAADLSGLPWWLAEDAAVETAPTELRLHLRSWRAVRTTPDSRVDVGTGDEETNAYRGFFARRFQSGFGLQFAFQQYGTQSPRLGGDGDQLTLGTRLGWARGDWSVDGSAFATNRTRRPLLRFDLDTGALGGFDGRESVGLLRVGWRDPDGARLWAQALAASQAWRETTSDPGAQSELALPRDTVDSAASRAQYVVAIGGRRFGVTWSGTARYRRGNGDGYLSPQLRASWAGRRWLTADLYAERSAHDSLTRVDLRAAVRPLRWLEIASAMGMRDPFGGDTSDARVTTRSSLLTAGVRWRDLWLRGGVISRGEALLAPPSVFRGGYVPIVDPGQAASLAQVQGRVWKDVNVDASVVRWDAPGVYRPQIETRARLFVDSRWLSRFPKGEFRILAGVTYEGRDDALFPTTDGSVVAPGLSTWNTQLEIQLQSGTIFWQWRNVSGTQWATVPGLEMPRLVNLYGVRWAFSN